MALTIGTHLGPYEVVGFIGAGGMGEVYRATDTRLGRTVAIKVLPADLGDDADPSALRDPQGASRAKARDDRRSRLLLEARSTATLNHPHICALYDVGREGDIDFLVMEYLEGRTLASRLASGSGITDKRARKRSGVESGEGGSGEPVPSPGTGLPLSEALQYATQIADALAQAHRQGIVHRDIKPANVMLTKEGAKLLDFGLAKPRAAAVGVAEMSATMTRQPLTASGMVVGTVPYMAPEQLEGHEADARTDIFAFGALLYEMVSGRRAFGESSHASLIAAIMTRDPEPLAALVPVTPPSLDRLVRQCLAKDPDKRWQSAGDLARQLEWIAEEVRTRSSASGQVSAQAPAVTHRRRLLRLVAAAAALVLAAAAVVGSFLAGRGAGDRPLPRFNRLTFRRGTIDGARFTPDGQNVLFTASWDGDPRRVYTVRSDSVDATVREGLDGMNIAAVSSRNELLLRRGGTLVRAPLAGGAPRPLLAGVNSGDWSPDGSQIAVARGGGTINTVEYPAGTVIYKTTKTPSDIRISPRGDLLAFKEHSLNHGFVVIIDTKGRERARSAFHDGVDPPLWTPDGKEVWFTTSIPHGRIPILALDLSGRERTVLSDPTLRLRDVSRDGRALLVSEEQTYNISVKAPGSTSERNMTWYSWSLLDGLSSDGRMMTFTEGGESDPENGWSSYLRSTDGALPQHFEELIYSQLSPDGKWLAGSYFDKSGGRLKFVPTGAGESRFVNPEMREVALVGWLPDSSGIVYWSHSAAKPDAPDQIWAGYVDGRPSVPISKDGLLGIGMGPGGTSVLAQTSLPNDPRTFLLSLDGREEKLLPGLSDGKWAPIGWDAGGRRVRAILRGGLPIPIRVFRVDPMTGDAQPWKELGGQLDRCGLSGTARVRFSDDGESYAYNYQRRLSTLYIVDGLR